MTTSLLLQALSTRPCGAGTVPLAEPGSASTPPVMTVEEVSEYLRIPRSSVYKLARQGRIPCQKVGRHWRFRREALDTWLESAGVSATGI